MCFFDTEKRAYEYCKEKAEQYSEESGRDLFNVSIYDPDEREVELYIGDDYFHWWYSEYNIKANRNLTIKNFGNEIIQPNEYFILTTFGKD